MVDNKRTIRVGAFDYEFKHEPFGEDADCRGYFNAKKLTISVDSNIPAQQQFEVLFHEVLHAIFEQLNIKIDSEEKFIEVVSPVLARFILDNWATLDLLKKEVHNDID